VVRVPLCVRVSRVSRVCPGSPRCLFTGPVYRYCVLLVGFDGCEVRLCGLCAFVRPRVPCVSCVSRLPPVSFYRYCTGPYSFLPNRFMRSRRKRKALRFAYTRITS